MGAEFDFGGYATRNDLRCSDGRTIRKDAFKHNDGATVPLVWQHQHNSPDNVLGHALLENREDGVYAYGKFNNTPKGKMARELVEHGDITSLSIFANQLKQNAGNVVHGCIREVSLVLTGANPGAVIDFPMLQHGDEFIEQDYEAIIHSGIEGIDYGDEWDDEEYEDDYDDDEYEDEEDEEYEDDEDLEHADDDGATIGDVLNTFNKDQQLLLRYVLMEEAGVDIPIQHSDEEEDEEDLDDEDLPSIDEVYDSLTDEQKDAFMYVVDEAKKYAEENPDEVEHSDEGGNLDMSYNVFEQDQSQQDTLMHAEQLSTIIEDGKRFGSLKESFLQHADEYGITSIDYLFPEAHNLNQTPGFIKRKDDWVAKVMNGVHRSPFSRIKSVFANITEDEARAKGYIKGKMKKEEVFPLLKRQTGPTTVYKKQKLDRDDVVDITDFDVVSWLKTEMRMMLDEELARAFLFGDGRLASDDDKISPLNIRPIVSDDDLYTIKTSPSATGTTAADIAGTIIDDVVIAMDEYRGSGMPTAFMRQDIVTRALLLKDGQGYRMYKSLSELATAMMVKEIVPIPNDIMGTDLYAVVVNLDDYNVGADKGGSVEMFDDFDIDYNQMKYLIETRCSGALTKPYSAIAVKKAA